MTVYRQNSNRRKVSKNWKIQKYGIFTVISFVVIGDNCTVGQNCFIGENYCNNVKIQK